MTKRWFFPPSRLVEPSARLLFVARRGRQSPRRISEALRLWAVAALVVLLAGCGAKAGRTGRTGGAAGSTHRLTAEAAGPTAGGTLTVAVSEDAKSLDPHTVTDAASMRMIENMYSTLLRYGKTYGSVAPNLAASVKTTADHLTVTIRLRRGVRFHSGRPVAASDVIYSIHRIIDKKIRAGDFEAVRSMTAPDAHTVVLHLSRPAAPLKVHLAYPMNAIVDRRVVEQHGGTLDHADAGSGPFRLVEWRRNQRLVLAKFGGYYLPHRPYLDRLIFRPMSDRTARSIALRTAEVQLVTDVPPRDAILFRRAEHVVVKSVPGTFWEYLGMNTRRPPLDDVRVRRAVALAIDRPMLDKLVKFGRAAVLDGGDIPPQHWAYPNLSLYRERGKKDIGRARKLLAQAGHPDGLNLTLKVNANFGYQVQAAGIIKQQLRKIGVRVRLRGMESQVFYHDLNQHDFDLDLVGWVGFVDPDDFTYNLFHTGGKYNQQQYSNRKVDRLLERGRKTLNRTRRKAIYARALRIIAVDAPMAFLYVNAHTSAWRDNVHGFEVRPTATLTSLRDTWIAPPGAE